MTSTPTSQQPTKGKMKSEEPTQETQDTKADGITASPPVCIICIGMAGSGKTTFVQRLNSYLHTIKKPPYILNLDPAVSSLPFQANIDIRDTVNYKQVMKQYNLGPNGGILTALNLFTTKFDQVLNYVEKRSSSTDFVLLDTPGQIEIFTWSASGAIITDAIASSLPTVVAYIIDTPRTTAPATFMSNMLYACSILYKTRLPFILVFNKVDVQSHDFALEWMQDFESFQQALVAQNESNETEGGSGYMSSLMNSMSLVLDEFYKNLRAVGCSAMTGFGMKEFFEAVDEARQEYETDYRPELARRREERERLKEEQKTESLTKLAKDLKLSASSSSRKNVVPDPASLRADELSGWEEAEGETLDKRDVSEMAAEKSMKKSTYAVVICFCLLDVLHQLTPALLINAHLIAIVLGSTLLVLLVSLSTSVSRFLTVRRTLASIPKPYVPISSRDLPSPIFQIINREFGRIAIIHYLAAQVAHPNPHPLLLRPHEPKQRLGVVGWGKPGSLHHGKRFADHILKDWKSLERALDGLLPIQPHPPIPTRHSSTIDGPLTPYMHLLAPASPTQPTPILLTPPQKLILNRYAQLIQKSISPNTAALVTEVDYETACKCLVILVDQVHLARSPAWANPVGYGHKDHPLYQGIRFKDAIIETGIKLEQVLTQKLEIQSSKTNKSIHPPLPRLTIQTSHRPSITSGGALTSGNYNNSKEMVIENLLKKILPLISPPVLPSLFGPIIAGYEKLIMDIVYVHPAQERTLEEYEHALRCIASIIAHVSNNKL
ncbi:hypothetical protein PCANC_00597 [Puccinia coronata f. sp. avenae]|uniref:GPN-loop GTPase 1 n=1 Tax=Puccinia coronata f. sp. avenae TaxID=200324 RepID=A0A2N5W7X3_9BASI|nr:hypothetical protein PCANC_00597 [Puccinia coronata f. sp. avenae]